MPCARRGNSKLKHMNEEAALWCEGGFFCACLVATLRAFALQREAGHSEEEQKPARRLKDVIPSGSQNSLRKPE